MKKKRKINFSILKVFIPKIIIEIILFLIGLSIFVINIGWLIHSFTYVETTATIYKVIYDENYKLYRPIYEYKHNNNKKYRVLGTIVGEEKDFVVGDKVSIIYNTKNYNKIEEGSKKDSAFVWIICIVCLIISSTSLYISIKKFKKYKEEHNPDAYEKSNDKTEEEQNNS